MKIYFTLKSKHPVGISCISSVPLASYICMYLHDKHILRITTKFYFIIAILVTKAIFRKKNQENQVNRTLLSHFHYMNYSAAMDFLHIANMPLLG